MHLCKELSCAVHRLTRAVQMYWLAHLASASLVPRPLAARRRAIRCADCFMTVCALGRTAALIQCSLASHTPPKGEGLVKRYWTRCVACQEYGQTNQIAVCVHVAKAYALRGIEAAEDSSATNLGCSNLREKQNEAIISFVSGKDVLVHLPTANESLFATLCYSLLPWLPCVFHIPVTQRDQ